MTAATIPAHTLETRLVAATELVITYNIAADRVTVDGSGITIAGDLLDALPDLTATLNLQLKQPGAAGEPDVWVGETYFDQIPVTVENHQR